MNRKETLKKLLGPSGLHVARLLRDTFRAWRHESREAAPIAAPPGEPPIPPARLVFRVAGTFDLRWFLDSGLRAAQSIRGTLADHGVRIEALSSVLDFGCGCVRWCRRNLRRAFFAVHGVAYVDVLSDDERRDFHAGRLVVRDGPPGSNLCAAYHPEQYVRGVLAADFSILDLVVEGATGNPRQDLLVLRK